MAFMHTIRQFLNWWFSLLREMVPEAVINLLRRLDTRRMDYTLCQEDGNYLLIDRQAQIVEKRALQNNNEHEVLPQLLKKISSHRRGCLFLPTERVLILTLSYPVEVMQNIERVLQHDLEKQIPLALSEVDYIYVTENTSSNEKVTVHVAVVKKAERLILQTLASEFGGRVICTTAVLYEKWGSRIDFFKVDSSATERTSARNGFYLWLNLSIVLAIFVVPIYYAQVRLDNVVKVTSEERQRAKQLLKTVRSVREQANGESHLIEELNQIPSATEILALLSRTITSQAWIIRLDYDGQKIRLHGEADSASAVTDDLNRLDRFENIKFTSSIVKNAQTGKESFKLLMAIKK